jgi:hypothetical protein
VESRLTSDIHKDIKPLLFFRYLNASSFLNYARSSGTNYRLVMNNPALKQRYETILDNVRRLQSHAALGEWDAAHLIWSQDPSYLECRGTVFHPNCVYQPAPAAPIDIPVDQNPGRYKYINQTPWQIALRNEEYEIADEMGQLMTDEEKQIQFLEIFPDGEIKKYNWDIEHAKQLLTNVFTAITQDAFIKESNLDVMSESTREALNALYLYVKPVLDQQTGLVFDTNIYVEALKLFENKFNQFQKRDQRSFWCVRVEEHLASLLGTGYLRPHAQGIGNNLTRTGCLLADQSSYFPFRRDFKSIPGVHFFVGYYGERCLLDEEGHPTWRVFSKLVSSKNSSRGDLTRQYSRPKTSACLVC